jgi:6-phosphogluconolactonase (cycloisomerase 2 family)
VSPSGALALVSQQPSPTGNASDLAISPNGKFLFAVDDNNAVLAYTIDTATGKLTLVAGSPFAAGDQPSTIAVDPSGRFVYAANQGSSDISAYSINADGSLTPITGSPFPAGIQPLQITVDPSGRFVYTTNLSDQNISLFIISSGSSSTSGPAGALTAVGTTSDFAPVFMTITR